MADVIITKQELIDAQKDAKTLEDVINGAADTQVTARLGRTFWTLATLNSKLNSVETTATQAIANMNLKVVGVEAVATQGLININNDVASVETARVAAESQMNAKVASVEQIFDDKLSEWGDEAQGAIGEWESAIALITQEGGVPALAVSDASGVTQQNINDLTGAPYRFRVGGYNIGERVVLENGDIVQSVVAGNTVDPNVDMTGWENNSLPSKNRIVYFEDFVSDVTGTTDVTTEMQDLLDSHDGDIYAKQTSIFRTTKTLFNRKHNRTIDFHNAKIINKTNSRYAIVSISPAFTGTTDVELLTFMEERHYGQEIIEAHIKDLRYEMQPNTSGGGNLGVGIVYGDNCTLRKLFPESTNGNGTEIRNSIQCGLYESDLSNFRNYSAFIFMSKKCTISNNRFSGGVDGLILKQNRDGDADCGHIVSYNIFDDAGTAGNAIGGGVWRETVLTGDIYVPNHQWVDGVEVYGNTFICRTTLQKVSPSVYARDWDIHNNTFKCNDLAGTLIQIGGQGNPAPDMVLSGGHKFHSNYIYNIDSPANALIDARLNCSIYGNKFYNVKAIYPLYVRDTMLGTKTDSVEFYDNEFIDCGIYCSGSGSHGFSATSGNKRFRFSGNKGIIKALVRGASVNLTALYSASESTELYDNNLTFISTAGINSITAQSFGATKISRLNNQTLTVDATIPLATATALQTSAATEVQDKHSGNKYILKGTATTARAVLNSADMIDGNNTYIGDWTTRIYNNFAKPVSRLLVDRQSATRPTTGTWLQGDFVRNTNPTVSAGFVVFGWLRLTSGAGNALGTDWVEIKQNIV